MLFCSTSFVTTLMRRKIISHVGPLSVWSSHILLVPAWWVFSQRSGFLTSQSCARRSPGVSQLFLCEWECPFRSRVGATCALSCQETLPSPKTLNWNMPTGKSSSELFLFIFLKWIHSSHLFQCVLLEVFWVFI